jgi:ABC-type amino acid transport substrate-binding protein
MNEDPSMHLFPDGSRIKRRSLLLAAPLALALPWIAKATELQDLDKVRASGVLKVAVYKDNAPYSYDQGQAFTGLDVALAQGLAKELGLQLSLMPFDAGEKMNDDLRNMVWRGHYLGYGPADVMLHVPVDKYLINQNQQTLIFAPYAREVLVVFHRLNDLASIRSGEDLKSVRLSAERGSGAASILMGYQGGMLREQVRIFNSGKEAAMAVIKGETSAAYVTRAQAESAVFEAKANGAQFGYSELGLPGLADNGWPIGMAVKVENKLLAQALEAALNKLRSSGELQAMFQERGLTLVAP